MAQRIGVRIDDTAEHCAEHIQAMRSVNGEEDDSANQRPDSENPAPRA